MDSMIDDKKEKEDIRVRGKMFSCKQWKKEKIKRKIRKNSRRKNRVS